MTEINSVLKELSQLGAIITNDGDNKTIFGIGFYIGCDESGRNFISLGELFPATYIPSGYKVVRLKGKKHTLEISRI